MTMAIRLIKGASSTRGPFALLCAAAGARIRYSTAAAVSSTTTTVTSTTTTPAGHGAIAHGTGHAPKATFFPLGLGD